MARTSPSYVASTASDIESLNSKMILLFNLVESLAKNGSIGRCFTKMCPTRRAKNTFVVIFYFHMNI